jgi:hypothetical protein
MKKHYFLIAALASLSLFTSLEAQTRPGSVITATNLPDISVMGNFQASTVRGDAENTGFAMKEIELAIQGYLYPTIRSDIFLGIHQEAGETHFDIEEAFLTFSGVADGLGFKVGKKKLSVGKQNLLHPEQWLWVDQPRVVADFLGEEGLSAEGVSLAYVLPLPFFLQAELGVWQKKSVGHHHDEEDEEEDSAFAWSSWLTNARLWSSVAPMKDMELEWGVSLLTGSGAEFQEYRDLATLWGTDVTLRYWLEDGAKLTLQGEAFALQREVEDTKVDRLGGYGYLGYKPNKTWEFGIRGDYSPSAELTKTEYKTASLIGTYQLTETSKFRLQYRHDLISEDHGIFAQVLFGVGPHSHVLQ